MDLTALTLFGRARYAVLRTLFTLGGSDAIHLREVARRSELSPTAAQYELRRLVEAGIAVQEDRDGRTLYHARSAHPIERELRSIVRKTQGARSLRRIADDAFWKGKRRQQHDDYASDRLQDKSPFLADPAFMTGIRIDWKRAKT